MFELKQYLAERSRIIDKVLDRLLPKSRRKPAILHKAMRYSVFSGGKRIRPILCLAAAEASGSSYRKALIPAAAIELLHTYTLIHDDLPCMDNDNFRRGKPTSHRVFGEANAVLAGDALQTFAFEILAKTPVPKPYLSGQLIIELAQAAGSLGVAGGQVEDLAATGKQQTRKMVEFIHLHKTADLFKAAARMGAIAGRASRQQLASLTQYGVNLGLAFQIIDDIIDESQPGTRCNRNKNLPEFTSLSIFTPEEARQRAKTLIDKATASVCHFKLHAQPLIYMAQFVLNRSH
ncbi:MAG: polyprenyl synthetase family protein [Kiritimatiellae bacterium]|nr:polyprenyl synthetase family protein [Kiritimatiellia bacterium]MDD5520935.1 polyprenyl synthetase family protein [Kiritimatiellia bacterium]